jgi:Metal-independent alpha-mannosidase (GH125)
VQRETLTVTNVGPALQPGDVFQLFNMVWPLGVIIQGLTATSDQEIRQCLDTLQRTHAGTGFIHEAFHKDDLKNLRGRGLPGRTPSSANSSGRPSTNVRSCSTDAKRDPP